MFLKPIRTTFTRFTISVSLRRARANWRVPSLSSRAHCRVIRQIFRTWRTMRPYCAKQETINPPSRPVRRGFGLRPEALRSCTSVQFPCSSCASLLWTLGLPELIAPTPQAYEDLAVELATNAGKLAAIKSRVSRNRLTTPLFDTQHYTRHLEAAYAAMHKRRRDGLPPDHIFVAR